MDKAEIDASGHGLQYYAKCLVQKCAQVNGQQDVFLLETDAVLERTSQLGPKPGQFYLIRNVKSGVEYNRPISVYHSQERIDPQTGFKVVSLQFLILKKGQGTQELCSSLPGDEVQIIGPLGNDYISPEKLTITTDDGSEGVRGMLPVAFSADVVKFHGYKVIFACGPTPMLSYVKDVAAECGIPCFVSMENRMLCGVGVCLGCTIPTIDGNRRVCKDGPVFDASVLVFEKCAPRRKPLETGVTPDLSVNIAGVRFDNPVIAAGGTFGFGQNYRGITDVNTLGGIVSKGVTLEPRLGNSGRRIVEVASGNINSIGLQNPGVPHFIEHELPEMLKLKPVIIANLAGGDLDSYVKGAELLDKSGVPMIELNISCPNVKAGGQAWGIKPEMAEKCVQAVRKATSKPLMVKLSPNAPDIVAVALACIGAGANALSLINTISAVSIDIEQGKPVFNNIRAGFCGPAVKPIALRMVYDVVAAINKLPVFNRVPVVGIGGIASWQDAVEFIMAGASAVQVGSAKFVNPYVMDEIIEGLSRFMKSHGYRTIEEMRSIAQS